MNKRTLFLIAVILLNLVGVVLYSIAAHKLIAANGTVDELKNKFLYEKQGDNLVQFEITQKVRDSGGTTVVAAIFSGLTIISYLVYDAKLITGSFMLLLCMFMMIIINAFIIDRQFKAKDDDKQVITVDLYERDSRIVATFDALMQYGEIKITGTTKERRKREKRRKTTVVGGVHDIYKDISPEERNIMFDRLNSLISRDIYNMIMTYINQGMDADIIHINDAQLQEIRVARERYIINANPNDSRQLTGQEIHNFNVRLDKANEDTASVSDLMTVFSPINLAFNILIMILAVKFLFVRINK